MDVSIIVPCFNEEKNIGDCLKSLVSLNYQYGSREIIVVDGGSNDHTQSIIRDLQRIHEKIILVVEPKKGVAAGRNAGVKTAKYDYVALIDADCEAPSNWLTILVKNYLKITKINDKVIAVGGANNPPANSSKFLKAIGVALDSYFGSFSSPQGRQFKVNRYVASLASLNVLYKKRAIVDIGYYDESLFSEAEDADLNYRLSLSGCKLIFIPESFVLHKLRPTPKTWLTNMFRYGKGRARLLKRYPGMWQLNFTLPILFILAMVSVIFSPANKIFLLPLLYFLIIMLFSFSVCFKRRNLSIVFYVMAVYVVQHFGYAIGEVYGLLNPRVK